MPSSTSLLGRSGSKTSFTLLAMPFLTAEPEDAGFVLVSEAQLEEDAGPVGEVHALACGKMASPRSRRAAVTRIVISQHLLSKIQGEEQPQVEPRLEPAWSGIQFPTGACGSRATSLHCSWLVAFHI